MAKIVIQTTQDEQRRVLVAIKMCECRVVSIAEIAGLASLKQSRARYALMDLIDQGIVEKVPAKAFNKNYIRYMYKVVRKEDEEDEV